MGRAGGDERALGAGGRVGRRIAALRRGAAWRQRPPPPTPRSARPASASRRGASRRRRPRPRDLPISASRHRRLRGQLPGLQVGLGRADERERRCAAALLVDDVDGRAERDRRRRRRRAPRRRARCAGAGCSRAIRVSRCAWSSLRDVVLGVLLEVAVLAGGLDRAGRSSRRPSPSSRSSSAFRAVEALRRDRFACAHPPARGALRCPPRRLPLRPRRPVQRVLGADLVERRALGRRAAGARARRRSAPAGRAGRRGSCRPGG